jgi:hypothetical protein
MFPSVLQCCPKGTQRQSKAQSGLATCRSMVICQDLLDCTHMLVIHHTDCGGQVHPASRCALRPHVLHLPLTNVTACSTSPLRYLHSAACHWHGYEVKWLAADARATHLRGTGIPGDAEPHSHASRKVATEDRVVHKTDLSYLCPWQMRSFWTGCGHRIQLCS